MGVRKHLFSEGAIMHWHGLCREVFQKHVDMALGTWLVGMVGTG